MAYSQTFKGSLTYANAHLLEAALDAFVPLDQGFVSFDRIEVNGLTLRVFVDGSAPASMFEESMTSVRALAQFAKSGEVRCSFEGDGDQYVKATGRSDVKGLPSRHRGWELRFAAKDGDAKALKQLLAAGLKPLDASSAYFNATLHQAAASGKVEAVRVLLKAGVPVDHRSSPKGPTPLAFAKSAEVIAALIAAGAKADAKVFVRGIASADERVGLAMIAHGVPLPKGKELTQVLADVVERGQVKLLAAILNQSAAAKKLLGQKPVVDAAVRRGDPVLLDFLLERGAKLPKGFLGDAAEQGAIELLRSALATPGAVKQCGKSSEFADPMVRAADGGHLEVMKLLAKHGVPVAPPAGSKTSPLLRAVIHGHEASVKWLLSQGASPNTKDAKGETAHDMAELFNHEGLAKLLKGPK